MAKDWFVLSPGNIINNWQTGRLESNIAADNRPTEFFNKIEDFRTVTWDRGGPII